MKLISCTEFVEKSRLNSGVSPFDDEQNNIDTSELYKIYRYANFLKQPLTLSMFVPCDDEGNVLEEPKYWNKKYNDDIPESELILCEEYRQAKERVIFEGFTLTGFNLYLNTFLFGDIRHLKDYTIENLIKYDLTITPNAVKTYQL